jgi:alpha-beta hydrolase superfamily lysophospholipase
MTIKIIKTKLSYLDQEINALAFLPSPTASVKKALGVFTHGYTSHKGSILSWATRLAEEGIGTLIFDQPGHFLGTYSEVEDFEQFKELVPELFYQGLLKLKELFLEELPLSAHILDEDDFKVILGGHSLGALTSLLALDTPELKEMNTISICVGLGMPPVGITHIFESPFYKSTLNIRSQLVSKAIGPEFILPWIKKEKENLQILNKRIHFITGADDIIVGRGGTQIMADKLALHNDISFDEPPKLPHHLPEMAAPHIKKFLRDALII